MYVDLNCIVETIATLISITFISCLIAITIYKLIQSWDEGKERYLANEENERREELNKKRLENLKLENLEVKLTREDIECIYVATDSGREGEYIYRLVEMQIGLKNKQN